MADALIFGSPEPDVQYTQRRAADVVVVNDERLVAAVESWQKYLLPGGGSLPGEAPEDTIAREVREELARGVRMIRKIGKATQYFYSDTDERHYVMRATFFAGAFTDEAGGGASEHELHWLPAGEAQRVCFHACHAWAISR